jgi:hypothetical protein
VKLPEPKAAPRSTAATPQPSAQPAQQGKATAQEVASALTSTCTGCHPGSTAQGNDFKSLTFLKGGIAPKSPQDILNAIDSEPRMKDLKGSDIEAKIRAWAAAQ